MTIYTVRQLDDDETVGFPHKHSDFPFIHLGNDYDDAVVAAYLAAQKMCFTQFAVFEYGVFQESYEDISCETTLDESDIRKLLSQGGGIPTPSIFDVIDPYESDDDYDLNNQRWGLGFAS